MVKAGGAPSHPSEGWQGPYGHGQVEPGGGVLGGVPTGGGWQQATQYLSRDQGGK